MMGIVNNPISRLLPRLLVFTLTVALLMSPGLANALTPEQKRVLDSGAYYFNVEPDEPGGGNFGNCTLPGANNAEKVWNFFISKNYSPEQTAGILGNMQAESGINPTRLQGTSAESYTSAADALAVSGQSAKAWGLVQWDPNSKVIQTLRDEGLPDNEIETVETQADFLWRQLEGQVSEFNEKSAGDHLKEQTTVEGAARSFMTKYERPADQSESKQQGRVELAQNWYNQFSSNTTGGGCLSLATGEAPELAQQLLDSPNVNSDHRNQLENIAAGQGPCPDVNNGAYTIAPELLGVLVALAQSHTFTISSLHRGCTGSTVGAGTNSRHWRGKAVDISGSRPIDGTTIPSFSAYSDVIQQFINDARSILPDNCELGVPNDNYKSTALATGDSPCVNVFLDTPGNTGATGPHVHLGVP